MNSDTWLVSALPMKSRSSIDRRRQDRSAMPNLLRWLPWPTLAPVADRLFLFTPDEGGQIEPAADEVTE